METLHALKVGGPALVATLLAAAGTLSVVGELRDRAERDRLAVAELRAFFDRESHRNDAAPVETARPDALTFVRTSELKDAVRMNASEGPFPGAAPNPAPAAGDPEDAKKLAEWGLEPEGGAFDGRAVRQNLLSGLTAGLGRQAKPRRANARSVARTTRRRLLARRNLGHSVDFDRMQGMVAALQAD
ncbi:MAG: hypothetical protein HY553_04835 [Elusimicrobia bacterium]|nr:hypothetical protein [Elusimicrobiota bacterium]